MHREGAVVLIAYQGLERLSELLVGVAQGLDVFENSLGQTTRLLLHRPRDKNQPLAHLWELLAAGRVPLSIQLE
jgi:hypothetical protein